MGRFEDPAESLSIENCVLSNARPTGSMERVSNDRRTANLTLKTSPSNVRLKGLLHRIPSHVTRLHNRSKFMDWCFPSSFDSASSSVLAITPPPNRQVNLLFSRQFCRVVCDVRDSS